MISCQPISEIRDNSTWASSKTLDMKLLYLSLFCSVCRGHHNHTQYKDRTSGTAMMLDKAFSMIILKSETAISSTEEPWALKFVIWQFRTLRSR